MTKLQDCSSGEVIPTGRQTEASGPYLPWEDAHSNHGELARAGGAWIEQIPARLTGNVTTGTVTALKQVHLPACLTSASQTQIC